MREFLKQFEFLPPLRWVVMEQLFYACANKMVEDYRGGLWEDTLVGKYRAVVAPGEGKLHVVGAMNHCDVRTDPRSAGIGFSILVVNWTWHGVAESLDRKHNLIFQKQYEGLRNAAFRDKTVDHNAVYEIID